MVKKAEYLSSLAQFGVSSLLTLVMASYADAQVYGEAMSGLAFLTLITACFAFRTYDFSFFLEKSSSLAFAQAFKIDVTLFLLASGLCFLGGVFLAGFLPSGDSAFNHYENLLLSALIALTVCQGSTQAFIRSSKREWFLVLANSISVLVYSCVLLYLITERTIGFSGIIFLWIACLAVRPVMLILVCLFFVDIKVLFSEKISFEREHLRFLVSGQMVNIVKNNQVAVETLILGFFLSFSDLALIRIVRGLGNISNVFLNISYQKIVQSLSGKSIDPGYSTIKLLVKSMPMWSFCTVFALILAFAFDHFSQDPVYNGIAVYILIAALMYIPLIMQQTLFAKLSLLNSFSSIGLSYLFGLIGFIALVAFLAYLELLNVYWVLVAMLFGACIRFVLMGRQMGVVGKC